MDAKISRRQSTGPSLASLAPRLALVAIVVIYLVLGLTYNLKTPKWNAPDEPAHFNYIRDIAAGRGLPVLHAGDWNQEYQNQLISAKFPDNLPIDSIRYESWQPPLYYVLSAPVYLATSGQDVNTQVFYLRLFSTLLGALLLVVAYATVREIFPRDRWLPLMAAGFVGLVPMYGSISASINNDTLANLLVSAIVLAMLVLANPARRKLPWGRQSLLLGVLIGLGLLTKTTVAIGVFVVGAGVLWAGLRWRHDSWLQIIKSLSLTYVVALVISGWWFVRNALTYGHFDILGKAFHDSIVTGQPHTGQFTLSTISFLATETFHSFWAQFGWMGIPADERTYKLIIALCLLAALGLVIFAIQVWRQRLALTVFQGGGLALLLLTLVLAIAVLVGYNLTFIQAQGRYLFPAIVAIAAFFSLGLRQLVPNRFSPILYTLVIAALIILNLHCIFHIISPAFGT